MSNEVKTLQKDAERVYHAWDTAWANNDIEALLALYADDMVIESPLIPYLLGKERGVCEGKAEFRKLLEIAAERKPIKRGHYVSKYFTDGETLMWEYPRVSPGGEQMDFVEIVELKNGLIQKHCVYWGWLGFNILKNDQYYR